MISVVELCKYFVRDGNRFAAVDQLSFEVATGEIYGLLGPNGAGKTTTIRMILGLMEADAGYAEVDGFRTSSHPNEVKRRVGFVSATSGSYEWLTGREMLAFFCNLYGLVPAVANARIAKVTELLGCESFIHQRCGTLSTGQKQRINLARAIVHDPPVLLLDEPTLGLDVVSSQVVFNYIRAIKSLRKSVILCTHRLEQAESICDRVGLMHNGQLAQQGTLTQLQQRLNRDSLVEMFLDMVARDKVSLGGAATR